MAYAQLNGDGVCVNTVIAEPGYAAAQGWPELTGGAGKGWRWHGGQWIAPGGPVDASALKAAVTAHQYQLSTQQVLEFTIAASTYHMPVDEPLQLRLAVSFGVSLFGYLPASGSYGAEEGPVTLTSGQLLTLAGAVVAYQARLAGASAGRRAEIDGLDLAGLQAYDVAAGWPATTTVVDLSGAINPPTTGVLQRLAALETWTQEASVTLADHHGRITNLEGA